MPVDSSWDRSRAVLTAWGAKKDAHYAPACAALTLFRHSVANFGLEMTSGIPILKVRNIFRGSGISGRTFLPIRASSPPCNSG